MLNPVRVAQDYARLKDGRSADHAKLGTKHIIAFVLSNPDDYHSYQSYHLNEYPTLATAFRSTVGRNRPASL